MGAVHTAATGHPQMPHLGRNTVIACTWRPWRMCLEHGRPPPRSLSALWVRVFVPRPTFRGHLGEVGVAVLVMVPASRHLPPCLHLWTQVQTLSTGGHSSWTPSLASQPHPWPPLTGGAAARRLSAPLPQSCRFRASQWGLQVGVMASPACCSARDDPRPADGQSGPPAAVGEPDCDSTSHQLWPRGGHPHITVDTAVSSRPSWEHGQLAVCPSPAASLSPSVL